MEACSLCPRRCGTDRRTAVGVCGVGETMLVARAAPHFWEEPCISGSRGSGTVFFAGCPLGCVYCQNSAISRGGAGAETTAEGLAQMLLRLEDQGVHNINLVTPMHFTPAVIKSLELVRHRLSIPVAVNTGGYELPETITQWDGLVDIWLPNLKYRDTAPAARYSQAADYFAVASKAIPAMHRQQPQLVFDSEGVLQKGLLVRHLVLPGARRDSLAILDWLAESLPPGGFLLSLMRQFTPQEGCRDYPEINRRLTRFEYDSVLAAARELGIRGFSQGPAAAREGYVPDFDLTGVE